MKTKRKKKKKKKKKRKEAKRKRFSPESISGPSTHRSKALPLGHVEYRESRRNFIIKALEPY